MIVRKRPPKHDAEIRSPAARRPADVPALRATDHITTADEVAALLDHAAAVLLQITRSRQVVYEKRMASGLLDRVQMFWIEDGVLRMRRAAEDAAFHDVLEGLALARQTSTVCLRSREGDAVAILDLRLVIASGLVVLRMTDLLPAPGVLAGRFAAVFGLTPAEARVAAAFLAGRSLRAISQAHGVEIGTIRLQVKRICAKAGASSQVELAGLLERAAAGFHDQRSSGASATD